MARKKIKQLFPKSEPKGIQGENLSFDTAGNDGRPVIFLFPDISDHSLQSRASHKRNWKSTGEDWRPKSGETVALMYVVLFHIQIMRVPGKKWFASEEAIAELKIVSRQTCHMPPK